MSLIKVSDTHKTYTQKLFVSPYKYFKAAEVNTDDQQASSSKKKSTHRG